MAYQSTYHGAEVDAAVGRALVGGALDLDIAAETARAQAAEALLAPKASPALTGNPTAPTQSAGDNSTKIATTEYADRAIMASLITESVGPSAVASFSDGADGVPIKSGTFQVEPKQDLYGQSYPYPAGGGKNKIDWKVNVYASSVPVVLSAGNYVLSAKSTLSDGNWYISGEKGGGTYCSAAEMGVPSFAESSTPGVYYGGGNAQYLAFTSPEAGVTFRFGKLNSNGTIAAQLEAGSTPTTFAPYSNICPITGWTGANIYHGNKNLMQFSATSGTSAQVVYTHNADGTVTANGTSNNSSTYHYTGSVYLKAGVTYKLSGCPSGGGSGKFTLNIRTSGGTWATDSGSGATFTVPADGTYNVSIRIFYGYTTSNNTFKPMVTVENAEQTFIKDTTAVAALDWTDEAGTVYGGTLEYKGNGAWKLTKTHTLLTMTSGGSWGYSSGTLTFYKELSGQGLIKKNYTEAFEGVADAFAPAPASANWTQGNYVGYYIAQTEGIRFSYPALGGDLDLFKAFIDGKQVAFPLATPTSYDLTGADVLTLLGTNNIWSDTGDAAVEYRADTKLYIDNAIASI